MKYSKVANFLALGAVVFTISTAPVFAQDELQEAKAQANRRIVIVHTNDIHGNVLPDDKDRGGLTRIATVVKNLRKLNPNQVVYLDAGDVAQGTAVSNIFKGAPAFACIAAMKPAAGTIGNHEFDWGLDTLKEMTKNAGYPFVLANVTDAKTGKTLFQPYRIVKVNGVTLGIIGLLNQQTPDVVKKGNTDGLIFANCSETAKKYIPKMRADGAEVIVALTHNGVDEDRTLANEVPEIDLIVGGHSHTSLLEPVDVGDHTWITQCGKYGREVGFEEIFVNANTHKVVGCYGHLIPINSSCDIAPDPEISAIVQKYENQVRPQMEVVVGNLGGVLTKTLAQGVGDCTLGSALCEALRAKTKADAAFYNYGGLRVDSLSAGNVTRGDVYKFLPFDDQVRTIQIKGEYIQELLNKAAGMRKGTLQMAGVTCTLDPDNLVAKDVTIGGAPLDPAKTYVVASTEFLLGGGDGLTSLTKGTLLNCYDFTRDVFIDYMDDTNSLAVPATGKIKVLE